MSACSHSRRRVAKLVVWNHPHHESTAGLNHAQPGITKQQNSSLLTGMRLPRAGRMVIVASGDVKHDDVVAHANKVFANLPADSTSVTSLVADDPSHFTGSAVSVRDPDMPQTGLAVAFKGAGHLDPDSVTLSVMANMLGSWSKTSGTDIHQRSKLAMLVASNGLADKIMGFSTTYHDTGLFGVYAQTTHPSEMEDLSWTIMNVRPLCLCRQCC